MTRAELNEKLRKGRQYAALKAAGTCTNCKKRPARPNRVHCEECMVINLAKQNKRRREARARLWAGDGI